MKQILLASTAVIAFAGTAWAQDTTAEGSNSNDQAIAQTQTTVDAADSDLNSQNRFASTQEENDRAFTRVEGDQSLAQTSGGPAVTANVDGNVESLGQHTDNASTQFIDGDDNVAPTLQRGTGNEAATVVIGSDNEAAVSQDGDVNAAAIAQKGDGIDSAIIQKGSQNAAVSSVVEDGAHGRTPSRSIILQNGDDNLAAHGQEGRRNDAYTYQQSNDNLASHFQLGNDNRGFISQGGGDDPSLSNTQREEEVDETIHNPFGSNTDSGLDGGDFVNNAASSVQFGSDNVVAIVQNKGKNEAASFQQGDDHTNRIYQAGGGNTSSVAQFGGNNNTAYNLQRDGGQSSSIVQIGSNNNSTVLQEDS